MSLMIALQVQDRLKNMQMKPGGMLCQKKQIKKANLKFHVIMLISNIEGGDNMFVILIMIILIVFLFDFTKFRKQNQTMIEQNDKIISLLEEIKNK